MPFIKKITCSLCLIAAIAGQAQAAEQGSPEQLMSALQAQLPNQEFNFMYVPSADSYFSNKMMVGMLKSGTVTSAAQEIIALLSSGVKQLAVGSKNEQVAAATLERALIQLKGKQLDAKVAYIGGEEYRHALLQAAAAAGVTLEFATP